MEGGADYLAGPATVALVGINMYGFDSSLLAIVFQGSRPPLSEYLLCRESPLVRWCQLAGRIPFLMNFSLT
jgi:hypothetical protein